MDEWPTTSAKTVKDPLHTWIKAYIKKISQMHDMIFAGKKYDFKILQMVAISSPALKD